MANYTLTYADLAMAVVHAVGGTPDPNLTVATIINDAISHLANMHTWYWRQRTLNLNSINAQSFIALPSDFNKIQTIKKVGDTNNSLAPASIDQIVQMRQSNSSTGGGYWYALSYQPQATATAEPIPILELFPIPTATTAGAPFFLTGTYIRQIPVLAGDTSIPDIPSYLHPALRMLCRAFAQSDEEQQRGADWAKFEDMITPLLIADGQATGNLGRARGGIGQVRASSLASNTRQINGP
jgi:hypothetical protein